MISRTDHEIVQCSCGKIIYYLSMSLSNGLRSYNHAHDEHDGLQWPIDGMGID